MFVGDQDSLSVGAVVVSIAGSPVVAAQPNGLVARFLVGFEDVELAVLKWIAAERRRADAMPVFVIPDAPLTLDRSPGRRSR
jgi:hypothetical protein